MSLLYSFLFIVIARICDVSLSTLRVAYISRGRKYSAAGFGFFEVLIWITVVSRVLVGERHVLTYIAYAFGFACGTLVGMFIEERLAVGWALVRVITQKPVTEFMQKLSAAGYGVTQQDAFGARGPVRVLVLLMSRKRLKRFQTLLVEFDPQAFYTIEDVRNAREEPLTYSAGTTTTAATGAGKTPITL